MTATTGATNSPVDVDGDQELGKDQIEKWLEGHGVTGYEYRPKLALSKIDKKSSHTNQARPLHPIDEDWVIILAEGMQSELMDFPPIVVEQQSGGKFRVLDGNHRVEAASTLDMTTFPAYVITQKLTETQERMLAITGNKRHGLSIDMDTRIRHAVWLVEARGMGHSEAARVVGAPVARVNQMVQLERATRRAAAVDHRATTRLSGGTRMRLDNVRSDVVHEATTKLAVETSMSQTEVNSLVSQINKHSTEQAMLTVVEQERKRREREIMSSAGGKVPMPTPYRNVRSTLARAVRIDIQLLQRTPVDPEIKKQVKAQAKDTISRLQQLVDNL